MSKNLLPFVTPGKEKLLLSRRSLHAFRDSQSNVSTIIYAISDNVYRLQKHVYKTQKRVDKMQEREVGIQKSTTCVFEFYVMR